MFRMAALLLALVTSGSLGGAAEVLQVDVRSILNSRSVSTFTDGTLVGWTRGIDGGGSADGYLTEEAARHVGDGGVKALPGNGFFPANAAHPEVQLNYSNADGRGNQTLCVAGAGGFLFKVPARNFSRMLLFMTSAEGPSQLTLTLYYSDGSEDRRKKLQPDYYNAPPVADRDFFVLAEGLAKWNAANRIAETSHHYIHGLDLNPNTAKKLTGVRVDKARPGYLVFWGATGVIP